MLAHKEVYITCIALQDIDAGDAIVFNYLNDNTPTTTKYSHPAIIKSISNIALGGKYCHGVTVSDVAAGDRVAVRIATAGTIAVKANWTGTLNPGAAIYPGIVTDGVLDTTGDPENVIGIYVGAEQLPETDSGSAIEVLIVRLSAVYVE